MSPFSLRRCLHYKDVHAGSVKCKEALWQTNSKRLLEIYNKADFIPLFGRSIRIAVRCCFGEHTFGVILKSFPAKESIGALSFFARALDKFASWCQRRSG